MNGFVYLVSLYQIKVVKSQVPLCIVPKVVKIQNYLFTTLVN